MMTLQISFRQGCLTVEMPPEVDIANAETVREQLREVCRSRLDHDSRGGVTMAVVDWTAATFLTMAGVAVLEEFRLATKERATPVELISVEQALAAAGTTGRFGQSQEP
ncbi:STAS domain-containing protein [Streptomyces sp. NPDC048441]|uniref:STAS domain-containing protein n=1 Tax=Streptomyces sp. NPDC048441 TaxID=3365552 RepID=UPI003711C94E